MNATTAMMDSALLVFVMNYFLPLVMALLGALLRCFPPRFQNGMYGYYTARSAADPGEWAFAQRSISRKYLRCGGALLALAGLANLLLPGLRAVWNCGFAAAGVAAMIACAALTERELKRREQNR